MRSTGTPYLLGTERAATPLERVTLDDRTIRESHLQEMLAQNPGLLPIARFDDSFAPAVSLGREIMGIDNLFMSSTGRLTLVETKLWRNPQAVREVLAQIVDYASRVAALDYESFEQCCRETAGSPVGEEGLFGLAARSFPDERIDEARFIDWMTRDLRNGRFLLLVVGDGIRDALERMLGALHHQSRLHFTFGLVEMRLYRLPDDRQLVVPSVVCHSTEIERAVVTVRKDDAGEVDVHVETNLESDAPHLAEQEFLDAMRTDAAREFCRKALEWGRTVGTINLVKHSVAIRVPFSTTLKGIVLMRIWPTGAVWVTPPQFRKTLRKAEFNDQVVVDLAKDLQELFPEVTVRPEANKPITSIAADRLLEKFDSVIKIYEKTVDRIAHLDETVTDEEAGDRDELE